MCLPVCEVVTMDEKPKPARPATRSANKAPTPVASVPNNIYTIPYYPRDSDQIELVAAEDLRSCSCSSSGSSSSSATSVHEKEKKEEVPAPKTSTKPKYRYPSTYSRRPSNRLNAGYYRDRVSVLVPVTSAADVLDIVTTNPEALKNLMPKDLRDCLEASGVCDVCTCEKCKKKKEEREAAEKAEKERKDRKHHKKDKKKKKKEEPKKLEWEDSSKDNQANDEWGSSSKKEETKDSWDQPAGNWDSGNNNAGDASWDNNDNKNTGDSWGQAATGGGDDWAKGNDNNAEWDAKKDASGDAWDQGGWADNTASKDDQKDKQDTASKASKKKKKKKSGKDETDWDAYNKRDETWSDDDEKKKKKGNEDDSWDTGVKWDDGKDGNDDTDDWGNSGGGGSKDKKDDKDGGNASGSGNKKGKTQNQNQGKKGKKGRQTNDGESGPPGKHKCAQEGHHHHHHSGAGDEKPIDCKHLSECLECAAFLGTVSTTIDSVHSPNSLPNTPAIPDLNVKKRNPGCVCRGSGRNISGGTCSACYIQLQTPKKFVLSEDGFWYKVVTEAEARDPNFELQYFRGDDGQYYRKVSVSQVPRKVVETEMAKLNGTRTPRPESSRSRHPGRRNGQPYHSGYDEPYGHHPREPRGVPPGSHPGFFTKLTHMFSRPSSARSFSTTSTYSARPQGHRHHTYHNPPVPPSTPRQTKFTEFVKSPWDGWAMRVDSHNSRNHSRSREAETGPEYNDSDSTWTHYAGYAGRHGRRGYGGDSP
ncbi:hypothetical protein ABW19_dt0209520 [Dactylella cylindrospora]|nr:hypothetical protein ABW19_dt0209520 [Dactylella cylindrospora]